MKKIISFPKKLTGLCVYLFLLLSSARGQQILHLNGTFCVGVTNTFVYTGPGTVTSWGYSGGTIVTQSSNHIDVKWNSPASSVVVMVNVSGSPSSQVYYPTFAIASAVTPSVSIAANKNNICAGTSVTFAATPVNGGSAPTYNWYVGGVLQSGVTSGTFTTSGLTNGQQVSCIMYSNLACLTSNGVASNSITMQVNAPLTMGITISGNTNICQGGTASFSASVSNTTGNLTYQWKKNGVNVSSYITGIPANVLVINSFSNNDVITCTLTSDGCATAATSNSLTVAIVQPQAFTVGIGVNKITPCQNETLNFTANPSQAANSYQWYMNGSAVGGATSSTFSAVASSVAQLQSIQVAVTTSAGCVQNTSATGSLGSVPFSIAPLVTPAVTISSDHAGIQVCAGAAVNFTSTVTNGGAPGYQWLLNGNPIAGAISSTYSTTTLNNNDQVSCRITSNAMCVTVNTVTSNSIATSVKPTVGVPSVPTGSVTACQGSLLTYTSSASNADAYTWSISPAAAGTVFNTGVVQLSPGYNGNATISVQALGCNGPSASASLPIFITPSVGTPAVPSGTTRRYRGVGTDTYTTSATNATGYTWSINPEAGTIDATGKVTWNSGYVGNAAINVVALGCNGPSVAAVLRVNVYSTLSPGSIAPATLMIPSGTAPSLLVADPAAGGQCNGSYQYQWQSSTDGITFNDVVGAGGTTYQPGALTTGIWYRRRVICSAETAYSAACQVTIGVADRENMNFIRVRDIVHGGITTPAMAAALNAVGEVSQQTEYFDGLGRTIQKVDWLGSNGTGDLVQPTLYDPYGREPFSYLSYVSSGADGKYKLNPLVEQNAFQGSLNPGESNFYSQTNFEPSPLDRRVKVMAPGVNWAGAGRGVTSAYWTNTATDDVKMWTVTDAGTVGSFGSYAVTGGYPAGQLEKTMTADESGHQVIEFKDNEGKVILKKVQLTAAADDGSGSGYTGWLCTYSIYDDYNMLRAVLQPRAVDYLTGNSWTFNSNTLSEFVFRCEYDQRFRMIAKQVPGAQSVYMVYDARDRVVLSQDGNMRTNGQWMYTLYDGINRSSKTGVWNNSQPLTTHLTAAYSSTVYPSLSGQTYQELTRAYYDNYTWAGTLNTALQSFDNSYNTDFYSPSDVAYPYAQALAAGSRTTGRVTGKQAVNLASGQFLSTVIFYDDEGRDIQVKSDNITQGIDVVTTQYSYHNKILMTALHQQHGGTASQTHDIWTRISYDVLWRTSKTEKRLRSSLVNGNVYSAWKTISKEQYDALGRGLTRTLGNKNGGTDGSQPLTTLDMEYNVRGWLLSINKNYLSSGGSDRYFGMQLGYDKDGVQGFAGKQFNGNIAGTIWKAAGDGQQRKYDFSYDAVNRLLKAGYTDSKGYDFGVQLGDGIDPNKAYDLNGNIKALLQKGLKNGTNATLDDLEYHYNNTEASNRLLNVIDHNNDALTQLGDFRTSSLHPVQNKTATTQDYSYDNNGNVTVDLNKDIADPSLNGIDYNYLNLPATIRVKNKGSIVYAYDANGNKLSKTVKETGKADQVTLYMTGGIIYQNDVLQFMAMEEGRVRYEQATTSTCTSLPARLVYDYFIKDQQGNVRTVLTEQQESICYLPATLEDATLASEKQLYSIQDGLVTPVGQVNNAGSYPQFNQKLYKLNGGVAGQKIGLGIVLRVMAGDKLSFSTQSIYDLSGGYQGPPVTMALVDLLGAFTGSPVMVSKGLTPAAIDALQPGQIASNFLGQHNQQTNRAEAYLNYILFDDQFRYVSGDVDAVQTGGGYRLHDKFINTPVTAGGNGYIYIFVSNESNLPVYFDNLTVTHTPGPLLEETQYYPFGLTMAGISGKALKSNYGENKHRYNGKELQSKEFSDGSGIEEYDYGARYFDQQIGRFHTQDRYAMKYDVLSPYQYGANNPVKNVDINGDSIWVTVTTTVDNKTVTTKYYYADTKEGLGFYDQNNQYVMGSKDVDPFLGQVSAALGFLHLTKEGAALIDELSTSNNQFNIVNSTKNDNTPSNTGAAYAQQLKDNPGLPGAAQQGGSGSTIQWNPSGDPGGGVWVKGRKKDNNPMINLAHELFHGRDANRGLMYDKQFSSGMYQGLDKSEWQAAYKENIIRQQLNMPLREYYHSGVDDTGADTGGAPPRILDAKNNPIRPSWVPVKW